MQGGDPPPGHCFGEDEVGDVELEAVPGCAYFGTGVLSGGDPHPGLCSPGGDVGDFGLEDFPGF